MKFRLSLLFSRQVLLGLGMGVTALCQAQTPVTDKNCPPPAMPLEQQMAYITNTPAKNAGFMWQLEKDGRTSWLYGTMHLNHIDYAKPGVLVMQRLRSSDVLALEINPYEPHNLSPALKLPEFKLSSVQLDRLGRAYAMDCLSFNAATVSHLFGTGPLVITQAQRQALLGGYSPDSRLAQIAKRTGKSIVPLESLEQQLIALAPTTQSEFDQNFELTMADIESGKQQKELLMLSTAWQQNDWPAILKLEQDLTANHPAFAMRLLDQRNALMAEKIDTLHSAGKRAFVAVGAMHMAGKTALPKLLQDKGYVVTYVPLRN